MAKRKHSVSFTNAIIDFTEMTITEIKKDTENTYDLKNVLMEFDNIEGVNLTISTDENIADMMGDSNE
jgi:hypothetical protein